MAKSTVPVSTAGRRSFIQAAGAAAAMVSLPRLGLAQPKSGRPNILFILADDLGYADLGCYGRRDYKTPVLDRLAADGLLMTQGYSNSAVCSPTRVALITGRYHQRLPVGLPEPLLRLDRSLGLPKGHPTLPSLLKRAGYRTLLVGKWHMGWPPEHGPLQCGYDHFFGIVPAAADYVTHRMRGAIVGSAGIGALYEGDVEVQRPGYLTDLLADRAVTEIRAAAAASAPFLLSLHFTAPHWPWQGPNDEALPGTVENLRHDDGGSFEKYAEMMLAMDAAIGRVLAELERQSLARNTIVVLSSDNGGERFSDIWPLRGGKGELLEGGIRVPLIVRWPDRIKAGSRSDQVMTSMDWLPTLVAAAGAGLDPRFPPDGENLLDVIAGSAPARPRKLFWRFRAKDQAAARDGEWKYLKIGDREGLFHIPRDPRENANLREREKQRFERLRAAYEAWNKDMLEYPPPEAPPPRSPAWLRVS